MPKVDFSYKKVLGKSQNCVYDILFEGHLK